MSASKPRYRLTWQFGSAETDWVAWHDSSLLGVIYQMVRARRRFHREGSLS